MKEIILLGLFALVAVPTIMWWEERRSRQRQIEFCRERRAAGYGDPSDCDTVIVLKDESVPRCVKTRYHCWQCRETFDRWTIR